MLCLTEKYHILLSWLNPFNNKRKDLVSKCRHESKYYLSNYKGFQPKQVAKSDDFPFKVLDNYTPTLSFDFEQ